MGYRRNLGRQRPSRRPQTTTHKQKRSKRKRQKISSILRELGDKRGYDSEKHLYEILYELLKDGFITEIHLAPKHSWADSVLKTDAAVKRRGDGVMVPIQAKGQPGGAACFIERWRDYCINLFGDMPVLLVVPPHAHITEKDRRKLKWGALRKINAWNGFFAIEPWMLEPSPFFDFGHLVEELGKNFNIRVEAFKHAHPQYFSK